MKRTLIKADINQSKEQLDSAPSAIKSLQEMFKQGGDLSIKKNKVIEDIQTINAKLSLLSNVKEKININMKNQLDISLVFAEQHLATLEKELQENNQKWRSVLKELVKKLVAEELTQTEREELIFSAPLFDKASRAYQKVYNLLDLNIGQADDNIKKDFASIVDKTLSEVLLTNYFLHFLKIPNEIKQNTFTEQLDFETLQKLRCASTTMFKLFAEPAENKKVNELFAAVNASDYTAADALVNALPSLMFQYVLIQKEDGKYEKISPLQLAIKQHNYLMYYLFKSKVESVPASLSRYKEQFAEQKELINIDGLLNAYKKLSDIPETDQEAIRVAFFKIGQEQSKIPKHMLRIFCSSKSWFTYLENEGIDAADRFDIDGFPENGAVHFFDIKAENESMSNLGILYSLCSFEEGENENHNANICVYAAVNIDSETQDLIADKKYFSCLYDACLSHYTRMQNDLGLSENLNKNEATPGIVPS